MGMLGCNIVAYFDLYFVITVNSFKNMAYN